MIGRIFSIAKNTFTESIRQPIFLVMLGLVTFALILALFFSAYTFDNDDKILIEYCLSMIFLGGLLLAALISAGVLSKEIENKTVLTVISKPVGRPTFIVGKFLGVSAAVAIAFWIWSIACLMLIRHEVMSTARDHLDMPVFAFSCGAILLAAGVAIWGNYFYNWVFTSRFVCFLTAGATLAYVGVLLFDKEWNFQAITTEFMKEGEDGRATLGQVILALGMVFEGLLILCAAAIACSTRLGQVMTLMICIGIYMLGVCSDYMFGRHAETNDLANILYHLTPNVSFLFVADALAQHAEVPLHYFGSVSVYAGLMIIGVLGLAVALFQTRETG